MLSFVISQSSSPDHPVLQTLHYSCFLPSTCLCPQSGRVCASPSLKKGMLPPAGRLPGCRLTMRLFQSCTASALLHQTWWGPCPQGSWQPLASTTPLFLGIYLVTESSPSDSTSWAPTASLSQQTRPALMGTSRAKTQPFSLQTPHSLVHRAMLRCDLW